MHFLPSSPNNADILLNPKCCSCFLFFFFPLSPSLPIFFRCFATINIIHSVKVVGGFYMPLVEKSLPTWDIKQDFIPLGQKYEWYMMIWCNTITYMFPFGPTTPYPHSTLLKDSSRTHYSRCSRSCRQEVNLAKVAMVLSNQYLSSHLGCL